VFGVEGSCEMLVCLNEVRQSTLTRRSSRVASRSGRFQGVEGSSVAGDVVVAVAAAGTIVVVSTARGGGAGVMAWERLSGNGAVKGAGGTRAVAAGTLGDWLGQLELGVVEATGQLFAHNGSTATANRSVGTRDPDTVNLDTALNGANTKGNLVLGLFLDMGYWLRLEHLGSRRAFALLDLAVLADLVLVIP
jgi:hypothetical protein